MTSKGLSDEAKNRLEQRFHELFSELTENEQNHDWEMCIINGIAILEIIPLLQKGDEEAYFQNKVKEYEENLRKSQDASIRAENEKKYHQLSSSIEKSETRKKWEAGINYCDQILQLLVSIGKQEEFLKWWDFRQNFILKLEPESLQKQYRIKLEDYPEILRQANILESKDKNQAQLLLSYCLALYYTHENEILEKFPNRTRDKQILISRLRG